MDRARRGTGLDGVDDDGRVKTDDPFHQLQPAPVVLRDFDIVAIGQMRPEGLDHTDSDAVVGDKRIAESEDERLHKFQSPNRFKSSPFLESCPHGPS